MNIMVELGVNSHTNGEEYQSETPGT